MCGRKPKPQSVSRLKTLEECAQSKAYYVLQQCSFLRVQMGHLWEKFLQYDSTKYMMKILPEQFGDLRKVFNQYWQGCHFGKEKGWMPREHTRILLSVQALLWEAETHCSIFVYNWKSSAEHWTHWRKGKSGPKECSSLLSVAVFHLSCIDWFSSQAELSGCQGQCLLCFL